MAIIYSRLLFSWKDVEAFEDLERLKLVIESISDEKFVWLLEKNRKNGRNDFPIRATWNALLVGIVFQHKSIERLRREPLRNAQFRELMWFWCRSRICQRLSVAKMSHIAKSSSHKTLATAHEQLQNHRLFLCCRKLYLTRYAAGTILEGRLL